MLHNNLDSIKTAKKTGLPCKSKTKSSKQVLVDGLSLVRRPERGPKVSVKFTHTLSLPQPVRHRKLADYFSRPRFSAVVVSCALLLAFSAGILVTLRTPYSKATEDKTAGDVPAFSVPLATITAPPQPAEPQEAEPGQVYQQDILSMPLVQLEQYLSEKIKYQQDKAREQLLSERTEKIRKFLQDWKSPLAKDAEVIARQGHWNLILAISFAESTLGKRCHSYNCSGIGVAPGHPQWREYKSFAEWIVDFNSLLERKYKNWSLEQMNGVYVQPKNPNWLLATKQVLAELEKRQIE